MFLWGDALAPAARRDDGDGVSAGVFSTGCHFRRCLLRRYRLRKYRFCMCVPFPAYLRPCLSAAKRGCSAVMYENYESYDTGSKGKGKSARGRRIRAQAPDQSASRARAIRCAPFPSTAACMERASASRFFPVFRQRKKQGRKRFDDLLFLSGVTGAGNPREALHVPGAGKLVVRQGETDRRHACGAELIQGGACGGYGQVAALHEGSHVLYILMQQQPGLPCGKAASSCLCACMGPVRAWILQEALGGAWRRKEASRPATLQASVPPVEIRRLPHRSRNAGASRKTGCEGACTALPAASCPPENTNPGAAGNHS